MRLMRIEAPNFVAGIAISDTGRVRLAASILSYMMMWREGEVIKYCENKSWKITRDFRDLSRKS
jgi:hypothetical protein